MVLREMSQNYNDINKHNRNPDPTYASKSKAMPEDNIKKQKKLHNT